ncbi:head-tail adaptor protein [Cereibacter johrii]|uniref:Head-tail adaptor n=1 Tax=Cereibacter johrii TaxID=445629 RepID=A0ABX5JDE4_9RHOB|nr:head-tail adaptor protein [Cereibacter johrii]ODM44496.1 phage tail protein [Cereibacter johrii]PTM81841.1 head-tail adaptor [Cereibacter johrii]QCP85873.1 head-tail adaptor protein [Cereibacter sphaeroides]RAZ87938.1 head-tail adaptor protein [Cereibacter johrii]
MGERLNRQLVLEAPVAEADGAGGSILSWTALGTVWGRIEPGTGRETQGIEIPLGTVPLRITVRAAPAGAAARPQPGQRFREGARLYPVLAVTEKDADGRYLMCFAREEVPA